MLVHAILQRPEIATASMFKTERVHCVWITDGVLKVLYESGDFPGPDHLGVTTTKYIKNQEVVQAYLKCNECIPHFKTKIDMNLSSNC